MIPNEVERAFAANIGLQPAVAMRTIRDNDTSVNRSSATKKVRRLNFNEAASLATPEEIPHFWGMGKFGRTIFTENAGGHDISYQKLAGILSIVCIIYAEEKNSRTTFRGVDTMGQK